LHNSPSNNKKHQRYVFGVITKRISLNKHRMRRIDEEIHHSMRTIWKVYTIRIRIATGIEHYLFIRHPKPKVVQIILCAGGVDTTVGVGVILTSGFVGVGVIRISVLVGVGVSFIRPFVGVGVSLIKLYFFAHESIQEFFELAVGILAHDVKHASAPDG
jgi:hypothetical protein